MKLTFSQREGKNEIGVAITLDKPTRRRVKQIAAYYKNIGWEPRGKTKSIIKRYTALDNGAER